MKYLPLFLGAAIALTGATASAQSMVKVGTVDMKKIFESYYKTKDAETRINEARNAAKKELDERMESYQKGVGEFSKLSEEIKNPALGKEAVDAKMKLRDEKGTELKGMEREITEFRQTREKQLQDQSARMRQGIVEDINKVVNEKVKADSYDLVFDKSGMSLNGVSVVMFAKESYDFTDSVVTQLNKNKGKDEPIAAEKPAKPAAGKPAGEKLTLDQPAPAAAPAGDKPAVVKSGDKPETPKKPKP